MTNAVLLVLVERKYHTGIESIPSISECVRRATNLDKYAVLLI